MELVTPTARPMNYHVALAAAQEDSRSVESPKEAPRTVRYHPAPQSTIDFTYSETPRILIVDDENGPRQSLRMLLKEEYTVNMATSVDEALALLQEEPVDLVITDIRMPNKTGMDLLREVRSTNRDTEFIILTGYGELDTAMKAIEYGSIVAITVPMPALGSYLCTKVRISGK